jgi:autophagy-related protein 13
VDDQGKRWDVLEALNSGGSSDGGARHRKRNTEVILERWKVELKDSPAEGAYDFGSTLPTIYKKCIVFFRSLYSTAKIVPAWRFVKSLPKSGSANSLLRLKCRILPGDVPPARFDALTHPLYENGGPVTTDYFLGTTETPTGRFSAEVSYRNDCNFRVDDSEALLSSRFMGADEQFFQPSLGTSSDGRRHSSRTVEVGSLPAHRQPSHDREPIQAYGSLSTFHGDVPPRATSPISALRAQKAIGSDEDGSPPMESLPKPRTLQISKASLRSLEGGLTARRPSVSFQPFKAGSLSSSPGRGGSIHQVGEMPSPQSPQSLPRASGISVLAQARNRSSLTAGMPASLRGGPAVQDNTAISSASSSPKPTPISRYSSSFTHRRGRSSFGGASKLVDDDQGSSGKQSFSSSAQPGSGILAEGGGSSGSLQTDDDNISEFLKLLDSKKTLQSFEPSGEASTKRTSAQLSKFQSMRESNNALTESMSSSTLLHRSSTSSSRQLSSVPHMVGATSMSTSSSPGKPISPHTPHTPAIPSRLSANSIAEYSAPRRFSQRSRATTESSRLADVMDDDTANDRGTNAIDIPTSPRTYYPHSRRSSSVAQQHRNLPVEEELGDLPFGIHRSISLGADDREPPSLSALLGHGQTSDNIASASSPSPPRILQPAPHISEGSTAMSRQPSSSLETIESEAPQARGHSAGSITAPYRPRIGRTGGRGITPPQAGSYSSLSEKASGSGMSERGGRYSFTRTAGAYEADDEPLLFDMSEIGRDQSRRSIEEPRGGGSIDKGGESSSSSRRGSRRGY